VESGDQIERIAAIVAEAGARASAGGAFKPRSSPYSFQGLGEEGLQLIQRRPTATACCHSEVMDQTQIPLLAAYLDIFQVGARNMQNFNLCCAELARSASLLLLKRVSPPPSGAAALRRVHHGRRQLRRHPVRARHPHVRNLHPQHHMDISAIPVVRSSRTCPGWRPVAWHGTPRQGCPMARAAVAAGATGC